MELTTCSALCNLPTVWAEKSSPDGPFSSRPFPLQPYAADWSGPFLFLGEVFPERKQHEKPLTDCTVRRRHSPLHWERLCFQRPCPPHHGNLGGFYGGCHLDLFPCHLVSWHVSRTLGALCRKNRPPKKWPHGRLFSSERAFWVRRMPFPSEAFPSSISFMGALAALVLAQATSHPYQPW